jgi:hypothetical protein
MHAPEPPRNLDEIVDDIMRELGDPQGRSLILPQATVRAEDTGRVELITLAGRVPYEPSGGNPILPENAIRAEVKDLVKRTAAGEWRWGREVRKAEADYARSIDDHFAEIEPMLADPRAPRFNRFIYSALAWVTGLIRAACQRQMQFQPEGHREIDQLKRDCASSVFYLIQKFSRRKISSSPESTFLVCTALMYEAVMGEPLANVKRACYDVLRKRRV